MTRQQHGTPSQRQLRVAEEIRHALAAVFERGLVRDPGLAGTSLTVTEVRVSPDLRQARVFVVPLGGGDAAASLAALARARPFLRREVARAVRLKFAPELAFEADASFDHAARISNLLASVAPPPEPEDDRNGP